LITRRRSSVERHPSCEGAANANLLGGEWPNDYPSVMER